MLRELCFADAEPLLDWLRQEEAAGWLEGDGALLTHQDAERFILGCLITKGDLHLAVTNGDGAFLGLVSLKHMAAGRAEFSVGLLPAARCQGYAARAATALLARAFGPLGLQSIYMYTRGDNDQTVAFNERQGFRSLPGPPPGVSAPTGEGLRWFGLTREQYEQDRAEHDL